VVYFFYMLALMSLDTNKEQTQMYDDYMLGLCFVHLFDAILYLWMWLELMSLKHFLLTPDWLNLLGALIYITSTSLYKYQYENNSSNPNEKGDKTIFFGVVRRLELSASVLELAMSFGWVWQWFVEYRSDLIRDPFSCVGRGFTLDDPDVWANITLIVAASYYVAYNVTVFMDYSRYDTCNLYVVGDQVHTHTLSLSSLYVYIYIFLSLSLTHTQNALVVLCKQYFLPLVLVARQRSVLVHAACRKIARCASNGAKLLFQRRSSNFEQHSPRSLCFLVPHFNRHP